MEDDGSAAFWSYSHEDDRMDHGSITTLARNLANAYSVLTGKELALFLDRDSLDWGADWRSRIDGALSETSFFIPILTPRYFQRPECRKETLSFYGKAKSLGVEELVLPVLYAPVTEFNSDNRDEVVAMLSRYQYTDWTNLRLEDPSSSVYRKEVNKLAQKLADTAVTVSRKLLDKEIILVDRATDPSSATDLGITDLMDKIMKLLPDWLGTVESSPVTNAQHEALWELLGPRLGKLLRTPGQGGAAFALTQRIAKEELPLAQRGLKEAQTYSQRAVELDPLILELLTLCRGVEVELDYLAPLRLALESAKANIAREERDVAQGRRDFALWARERAHHSRLVRELAETQEAADRLIEETNGLVENWFDQWEECIGEPIAELRL